MFSAQTYQDRRAVLQSNVASGILLFLGNIENPVNFEHNPYYFRQDSTFYIISEFRNRLPPLLILMKIKPLFSEMN
jgi:hypothetical protein